MIRGSTAVYALLGRPVRHSGSPRIHNALFARHGIDAVYVCLEPPEGAPLRPVLQCLAGANVTAPLKTEVVDALDDLTQTARAVGAVNTVSWRGGALVGDNTDGEGFLRGLREAVGPVAPRRVLILGAGGAARAVAGALAGAGAEAVTFVVRDPDRARAAVARLSEGSRAAWSVGRLAPDALAWGPDLVVDATPSSAGGALDALDVAALHPRALWCDLGYHGPRPRRFEAARARGLRTLDGAAMLRHQALLAFERFTGLTPDASALDDPQGRPAQA